MYLTIVMELKGGYEFLEAAGNRYTIALAVTIERLLNRKRVTLDELRQTAGLTESSSFRLLKEAGQLSRQIREGRRDAGEYLPLHCSYGRRDLRFDLISRALYIREERIEFRVDHYQWYLMNYLKPVSLTIRKTDGRWQGWLLGRCPEADYAAARKLAQKPVKSCDML